MPIVATATLRPVSPSPGGRGGDGRGGQGVRSAGGGPGEAGSLFGTVVGGPSATLFGHVSRSVVESLTGPSVFYAFAVKLADAWVPSTALVGPLELDESIDTPARLFTFTLTGRQYSIHLTETTWTAAPVEVWVTAGPITALRTWRRAFGHVLTCEQIEGMEPTLKIRCADPSRLYDRTELCYEFLPSPAPRGRGRGRGPADAGLTRGDICRQILTDAGFTPDVPAGALYTKPVITDSQKLWPFLAAFGEVEGWSWRLPDWTTVEAYKVALREPLEAPDDVWSLRDVLSIESAPPSDVPSQWVIRSTQTTETPAGLRITKQRSEVVGFYAIKKAVARQLADGTLQPIPASSVEVFQRISALETEIHEQAGLTVAKITREWGWYNPRAAKLRSLGHPLGPVEDGYYWAEAFLDEGGSYRAWRQESFVQTGERRELPTYDAEGTEIARRIETYKWYSRPMGVRNVGSAVPNVLGAGIGDDDLSWFPFDQALTALLRIEDFGLAQLYEITLKYGENGAVIQEIQETSAWYTERTAVVGVPWFQNYSGAGQKDLVAPFQRVLRKTTTNTLTADGLLAGTIETSQGFVAPRRVDGPFDWGDQKSNLQQETWGTTGLKTTIYNVLDESTYEEITDEGTGAVARLVMGRAPRPRYRASSWTRLQQTPIEIVLEDATAAAWWGTSTEILPLDYIQSPEEALAVAKRRRARRLAFVHTVIRPITHTKPGDTIHLIDPRTGLNHRCLVTRLQERWSLSPRPQILATYTLEQPL